MDLFVVFVSIGLMIAYLCAKTFRFNIPSGPWGVPVFGYLPFISGEKPHKTIDDLVKKHGKIFSIQLGQLLCIVLADAEIIRSLFTKCK